MSFISGISKQTNLSWQLQKEQIRVQLDSEPCSPEAVVKNLAAIQGPVDIYCWYEGLKGLPKSGALFMKKSIFEPLFALKKDVKFWLYSLKAWNFQNNIDSMPKSYLEEVLNSINKVIIECIGSASFFRYCVKVPKEKEDLYTFINQELPKKKWLLELSKNQKETGIKVKSLFNNQTSLFDCSQNLDVQCAYSQMQYIEGYYLIQESVKRGISSGQKKINIAFVLANDESKYYRDFPKDIEKMLRLDFKESLAEIEVNIIFQFFQYEESLKSRPYYYKNSRDPEVKTEEISSYFSFLISKQPFCKDVLHNLNGWIK